MLLDNEIGRYQANAHDGNENDLDEACKDTTVHQQCLKTMDSYIDEQLRGDRLW